MRIMMIALAMGVCLFSSSAEASTKYKIEEIVNILRVLTGQLEGALSTVIYTPYNEPVRVSHRVIGQTNQQIFTLEFEQAVGGARIDDENYLLDFSAIEFEIESVISTRLVDIDADGRLDICDIGDGDDLWEVNQAEYTHLIDEMLEHLRRTLLNL